MKSRNDMKKVAPKKTGSSSARRMATIVSVGTLSLALITLLANQPESAAIRAHSSVAVKKEVTFALDPSQIKPLKNYSSLTRRNIFRPLMASSADFRSTGAAVPELLPAPVGGFDLIKGSSPLSGWKFIGSATVGGSAYALLQNAETGATGYYKAGESVNGCVIRMIRSDMMILSAPGQSDIRLPKTNGITAASDASAAQKTAQNDANSDSIPPSPPAIASKGEIEKTASARINP